MLQVTENKYLLLMCLCESVLIGSWLHNDLQIAVIGPKLDLTYDYEVGGSFQILA